MHAASDDLIKPLGVESRPAGAGLASAVRIPVARVFGAGFAIFAGSLGAYLLVASDPMGGEPYALVPVEVRVAPDPLPDRPDAGASAQDGPKTSQSAAEVEMQSGVSVVRGDGTAAPGAIVIRVPDEPAAIKLNPAPDPRLVERTRFGILPRIGPDGARAAQVYARPASPTGAAPSGAKPLPRIALVVGGLGIGEAVTADAVAKLPAPVTLAFAPYGGDLERHVTRARDNGHEVMLQAPMEPFDYPDNDPGPHTLTARAPTQDNLDKLRWVMGRFTGYVGLVNFMGAKLTCDEAALAPVLREVSGRGLVFLDDGSSSRSVVTSVGASLKLATARADAVIDGVPRPEAVDRELGRLEDLARERGLAVGSASALPLTVERIARWAKGLEARGIRLVPVSSAFESRSRP